MEDEFASKVLEAIQRDGKVTTAILGLVCACPNVIMEYGGGGDEEMPDMQDADGRALCAVLHLLPQTVDAGGTSGTR